MLTLNVKDKEFWNEETNEFVKVDGCTMYLEHSLISLSKWEEKFEKPFMTENEKTEEELIEYIKYMTINKASIPDNVYECLDASEIDKIKEYMQSNHTATWFGEESDNSKSREVITAEIIYYWMIELKIPPEYRKWHLNRLMTLIRVINEKHEEQYGDKKKLTRQQLLSRNRKLNKERRAKLNSKG